MDNSNNPNPNNPDPLSVTPPTQPTAQDLNTPAPTFPAPTEPLTPQTPTSSQSLASSAPTIPDPVQWNFTPTSMPSNTSPDPNIAPIQSYPEMPAETSAQGLNQPITSSNDLNPIMPQSAPSSLTDNSQLASSTPDTLSSTDNLNPTDLSNNPVNLQTDPVTSTTTSSSPLDNPWSMSQNTNINSNPSPIPQSTYAPTSISASDQALPSAQPTTEIPQSASTPSSNTTTAPTDLSHLLSNNSQPLTEEKSTNSAETLVVPPQSAPTTADVPTASASEHKSMPKWLIGVAIGLLILVVGASAYFILGIGQSAKETSSLPAEVSAPTVKTPPPVATSIPQQTTSESSGSASFGQLQGSDTAPQATSAADIIKQRNQAR